MATILSRPQCVNPLNAGNEHLWNVDLVITVSKLFRRYPNLTQQTHYAIMTALLRQNDVILT